MSVQMSSLALLFAAAATAAAYIGSECGFGTSPMRFTTRWSRRLASSSNSPKGEESTVVLVISFRPDAF